MAARRRQYRAGVLVLRYVKLGEADKILTLYTREFGKVRAVAKGARKPGSRLGGHLDLLTHSDLLLAEGRNLDIVTQAQSLESFVPLKSDLWRLSCGLYVAEVLDACTEERLESAALFDLALDTLRRLNEGDDPDVVLRYFELSLLHQLGYRPELRKCAGCGVALQPEVNYFHPGSGGMLCPRCSAEMPFTRALSLNAFKVLRLWQECDYAEAGRVRIAPELGRELELVLRLHIRYVLDREIRSAAWLDRLRQDDTRNRLRGGQVMTGASSTNGEALPH